MAIGGSQFGCWMKAIANKVRFWNAKGSRVEFRAVKLNELIKYIHRNFQFVYTCIFKNRGFFDVYFVI